MFSAKVDGEQKCFSYLARNSFVNLITKGQFLMFSIDYYFYGRGDAKFLCLEATFLDVFQFTYSGLPCNAVFLGDGKFPLVVWIFYNRATNINQQYFFL